MQFKRKSNRISLNEYTGRMYYLTLCTHDRNKYFINNEINNFLLDNLKSASIKHDFEVWAYVFMPDHLHLLALTQENNDALKFIKSFKQSTGFYFKKQSGKTLWQKSFYDHIVRREEEIKKIVKYIFENPVRKRLVDNFLDYPYSGSLIFDKDEFVEG